MNKYNCFLRSTLCISLLMIAYVCYSQEEYEYVNTSSWKWSNNNELSFYSNSTNKLLVANNHAESTENKKNNKWGSKMTWLEIPVAKGKSYTITFKIKNEHNPRYYKYKVMGVDRKGNPKEEWHETNIYWGLIFQCKDKYGKVEEFEQDYNNRRNVNSNYTYTSVYNSELGEWYPNADIEERTIKIEYDGASTVKIFFGYGSTLMKTFYNTYGLTWIGIKCGCAAQILVTDFKMHRQTDFGSVLPEILNAAELIDNKNYSSAVSKLTNVLNTYKGAIPYYYRARAYVGQEYYKSAIEDCNNALQYQCEIEQKNNINFLRGFSKLLLNDDTGVTDMRQAGNLGMTFLRENDLLDYVPGQSKKPVSRDSKNSNPKSSIINRSTNRVPTLKKTN